MRVFSELTQEVDLTAQLYAVGLGKKEIAEVKCRSLHTIKAQLDIAFRTLGVSNGRELSCLFFKKVTGTDIHVIYNDIIVGDKVATDNFKKKIFRI